MIIVIISIATIIVIYHIIINHDHRHYQSSEFGDRCTGKRRGGTEARDFSSLGYRRTAPKQARTHDQFSLLQDTAHSLLVYIYDHGKHITKPAGRHVRRRTSVYVWLPLGGPCPFLVARSGVLHHSCRRQCHIGTIKPPPRPTSPCTVYCSYLSTMHFTYS